MNLRYVLLGSILILAALSGCTGGGDGGDTTTTTMAAPATTAPPATTAAPMTTAPAAEVALHGVGKCDTCGHGAPTLKDIRSGTHKVPLLEKEFHRDFCKECHTIETDCVKCHALPSVMGGPAGEAPATTTTTIVPAADQ